MEYCAFSDLAKRISSLSTWLDIFWCKSVDDFFKWSIDDVAPSPGLSPSFTADVSASVAATFGSAWFSAGCSSSPSAPPRIFSKLVRLPHALCKNKIMCEQNASLIWLGFKFHAPWIYLIAFVSWTEYCWFRPFCQQSVWWARLVHLIPVSLEWVKRGKDCASSSQKCE